MVYQQTKVLQVRGIVEITACSASIRFQLREVVVQQVPFNLVPRQLLIWDSVHVAGMEVGVL